MRSGGTASSALLNLEFITRLCLVNLKIVVAIDEISTFFKNWGCQSPFPLVCDRVILPNLIILLEYL